MKHTGISPMALISKHPTAKLGMGVTWPISHSLLQCGPNLGANKIRFKGEFHLSVSFHVHNIKKKSDLCFVGQLVPTHGRKDHISTGRREIPSY